MCCCPESNSLFVTFVIGKVSKGMVSMVAQRCGVANPEKNASDQVSKTATAAAASKTWFAKLPSDVSFLYPKQCIAMETVPCDHPVIFHEFCLCLCHALHAGHALHAFHTLHTCTLKACQWSVPSYHACHAPIYGHPKPIVAECHWPVEEKLCGSRHMYGPTGPMSRATHRSHTARMSRNAHRSRTHCVALHACHALHTFCVLNARENGYALMSRMSRTHNAWQAMNPGNARMSRTARMSHTTRMSHSYWRTTDDVHNHLCS